MRPVAWLLMVWLLPMAVGPAPAQAPPTRVLIDGLFNQQGRSYEEARGEVLARDDILDVVRESLETTAYGDSTWRRLVLAEALALHVTHPGEAERLRSLQGLDSDHYRLRRVPSPSAARELRGLRHVAPLLIELFLKGVETYAWSSAAAAEAEEAALRRDLLRAVGQSGHAASVHFLTDVVEGGCSCCESCAEAVAALGETGAQAAVPVLLGLLDGARANGNVEEYVNVVQALGGVRHAEVWPHIEAELDNEDRRVRQAAIRSAAVYGSRWHWSADPAQGARVRAAVGSSLLDVLAGAEDEGAAVAVLESLSVLATPQLRELLELREAIAAEAARSTGAAAATADRFQRALDRVDRTLARQQNRRNRERR